MKGWYGLTCWNGLSLDQQNKLIERGSLNAFDPESVPAGECKNGAMVAIELQDDRAPGPRFYCIECAIRYLGDRAALTTPQAEHSTEGSSSLDRCDHPLG